MGAGEFADGKDQARLVADSPALLSFHDGDRSVEYVRMDAYQAATEAMQAAWQLAVDGGGDFGEARFNEALAKVNRATGLAGEVVGAGLGDG